MLPLYLIATICCITNAAGTFIPHSFHLASLNQHSHHSSGSSAAPPPPPPPPPSPPPLFGSSSSILGLAPSQIPALGPVPSLSSPFLQNQLYQINLRNIMGIYINFTSSMVPVFKQTSQTIYATLNSLRLKSRTAQLYGIPEILGSYAPMFQSFARGTKIVNDWELANQGRRSGKGRQLFFTPTQWNSILQGLANFGINSSQALSSLNYMEYLTEFQLDNLQKGPSHTIIMPGKQVALLDQANSQLAAAIQGVRGGLLSILSVRQSGCAQLQTSKTAVNFLNEYFLFINEMAAVFNQMAPSVNNFGTALVSKGTLSKSGKKFTVKTKHVNKLYQNTALRMASMANKLAYYFGNFAVSVQGML